MSVEKVQKIFREVFERGDLEIFSAMTVRDVEEWDLFNHINLIVALEEEFGMTFTTDEIAGMSNVGDLVEILHRHGCAVAW